MGKRSHPARASRTGEGVPRRPAGTMSGGCTAPFVNVKMRAATLGEAPRARNRSFLTASAEMSPMRSAMPASSTPSLRIQSLSETMLSASLARPPTAPAHLPPDRLAEALAILLVDLAGVLHLPDRQIVLEGLANVLHRRGRTRGGTEAATMLGAVGGALMRLGA